MSTKPGSLRASFIPGPPVEITEDALICLGKVVSNFEMLNVSMMRLFCALTDTGLEHGILVFHSLAPKSKQEVVASAAYQRFEVDMGPADALLGKINRAVDAYASCAAKRNKIVHALWSTDDGELKRAYLPSRAESLDNFIGGYSDSGRMSKTQSERAKNTFSVSDMNEVRAKMVEVGAEIESILSQLAA